MLRVSMVKADDDDEHCKNRIIHICVLAFNGDCIIYSHTRRPMRRLVGGGFEKTLFSVLEKQRHTNLQLRPAAERKFNKKTRLAYDCEYFLYARQ